MSADHKAVILMTINARAGEPFVFVIFYHIIYLWVLRASGSFTKGI